MLTHKILIQNILILLMLSMHSFSCLIFKIQIIVPAMWILADRKYPVFGQIILCVCDIS